MIQVGDRVICVREIKCHDCPPVKENSEWIVSNVVECCGRIGLDLGLSFFEFKERTNCNQCQRSLPSTAPLYNAKCFRKVEPSYKVVEVHSEILEQAKELLTPETIANH